MRFRLFLSVVCLLFAASACDNAPPTLMVLVVSPTPSTPDNTLIPTSAAQSVTDVPTEIRETATPAPTPTLDPFPTPTVGQVQVAEQPFEHGRMFWIQPRTEIWVLVVTGEGRGRWTVYQDTFADGQIEFDPDIVPPGDNQYQPHRGFGKLWRENAEVRNALGWAVTPDEFGYISRYEYYPGGVVDSAGVYVPGPGYHILFSLYEEAFRFNEVDMTWQLGRGD
jgi:hypothetical protein